MADIRSRLQIALEARYLIERELGHGGMAVVLLAQDLKHQRPVALKILRPELAHALGPERFLREIEISARLAHPHIVPLLDSGIADGLLYYVMPFVPGESLRDRLRRETRLAPVDAVEITREVADALEYAHRSGVLHRDIKPENILFEAGHAVVADFGIARAVDRAAGAKLTSTGLSLGTPTYMSPEQAAGEKDLDARSDQYSLATVLYEMLEGTPPHTGPTVQAVMARRLGEPAPPLRLARESVPARVQQVLARALERAPADRYPSVAAFAEDLTRAHAEGGQPRGGPAVEVLSKSPLPRWVFIGAAAALALALLLPVWSRLRDRQPVPARLDPAVAVLPFRTVGEDLEYWREGMMDLLSFSLDGVGGVRVIDPATVTYAASSLGGGDGALATAAAFEVARKVGASYYLNGSVIHVPGGIRLAAEGYRVGDGASLGSVQVDGHPDSVTGLVGDLALELLREGVVPADTGFKQVDLSRVTTRSLPALKAYLEGERYLRQARYTDAVTAYRQALALDSTFGSAMHHLIRAVNWGGGDPDLADTYGERLRVELGRMSPREAILARATLGNDEETLKSLEEYTRQYPDDHEGWFLLGDGLTHGGGVLIQPSTARREPLERAIALNPSVGEGYVHLIELAFLDLDSAGARRLIDAYEFHIEEAHREGCSQRLAYDLVWGDAATRTRALSALDTVGPQGALYYCVQAPLAAPADAVERLADVYSRILASSRDPTARVVSLFRLLLVLVSRGEIQAARQALTQLAESPAASQSPWMHGAYPDWPSQRQLAARFDIMLHLSDFRDTAAASRAVRALSQWPADRSAPTDLFWLGAVAVDRELWSEASRIRTDLVRRAAGLRAEGQAQSAGHAEAYAAALDALESLTRGDRARLPALEAALSRFPTSGYTTEQPHTWLRYRVGRMLLDWNRLDDAERYFLSYHPYDYYTSQADYQLGRIYEMKGERDKAINHYQRFVTWWRDADLELRPVWEDARRRSRR